MDYKVIIEHLVEALEAHPTKICDQTLIQVLKIRERDLRRMLDEI